MANKTKRRGADSRSRPRPAASRRSRGMAPVERAVLESIFGELLQSARDELAACEAFEAEVWASHVWSVFANSHLVDADTTEVFGGGLIRFATKQTTPQAVMALLALAAVAPERYRAEALQAAERIVATGVDEPRWKGAIGRAEPVAAWLSEDPVDDDGVNVMVSFDGPAGRHTIGVYVDHNLAAMPMAKDCFAVPAAIDDVLGPLRTQTELEGVRYREISLGEAADRWRQAFDTTDMFMEPPVSDDLHQLRALVRSRLAAMTGNGKVPAGPSLDEDERERLLDEFLDSDEASPLIAGDAEREEAVGHIAMHAMVFSLHYVAGTPLRFSPVMVEVFCLDYVPRKVAVGPDALALVPAALAAWIRFVGRRRNVPVPALDEAVSAIGRYTEEMAELAADPANWGPAKTMALGMEERGVDLSDQAAIDRFVADVNRDGGIDALAGRLSGRTARRR